MSYEFYVNQYGGQAIDESQWPALASRARELLEQYKRDFTVTGTPEQEMLAVCALADLMLYFSNARSGQGGLRYASVGSVSVSGKGIYSQVDISPQSENRELYRCASRYLKIYRGCGICL